MRYYVLTHEHKHGIDTIFFKSRRSIIHLRDAEIARQLEIDYEEHNLGEYIQVTEVYPKECIEI